MPAANRTESQKALNENAGDVVIAITTFPDADGARQLAEQLVIKSLAACATIFPGATSIYRWQGKVEQSVESTILIKTTSGMLEAVRQHLATHHPYELPELLAFTAADGLPGYLAWVRDSVSSSRG